MPAARPNGRRSSTSLAGHPALAARTLILPGNHDVNIVDRTNPARLDLPTSPGKRLRQMRTLCAMAALQGGRARVLDRSRTGWGRPCPKRWRRMPARSRHSRTPDPCACRRASPGSGPTSFPMIVPPAEPDGLGILILNSNAEAHFSFTNALGVVSADQERRARRGDPAVSVGPVGGRPAPPSCRISRPGRGLFRADRNGADQWQLVRAPARSRSPAGSWRCMGTGTSTGSVRAAR